MRQLRATWRRLRPEDRGIAAVEGALLALAVALGLVAAFGLDLSLVERPAGSAPTVQTSTAGG